MNLQTKRTWPYYEDDEISIVKEILESGKVNYWTGNQGKLFEKEFADWSGNRYAIALANGSLALTAAYTALGLQDEDEFITTPRTFIATSLCGVMLGAKPIFADVDFNSGAITAETIEPLITNKTKVISVVHVGGWPADMISICKLAKKYELPVIEDCSQAHGAKINNKPIGSFGDISTWSFCQDKIITTGGEGGMVTTDRKDIWEKIWSLKDHGKNYNSIFNKAHSPGRKWVHENIGSNYRLTEMQSAIGRKQLKKIDAWNKIRSMNAQILINALKEVKLARVPIPSPKINHAWYKFHTFINIKLLKENWNRDRIIDELNLLSVKASQGTCSEIYLEECFKTRNFQPPRRLNIASKLGETAIMFNVDPSITNDEMHRNAEIIKEVFNQASH